MKSRIVKRSVVIAGQKTSVSLEDAFWTALKQLAREQKLPLCDVITGINVQRSAGNLSSAIRLFVLDHFRELAVRTGSPRAADAPSDAQPRVTEP
jgi:predicted DNA-binding ribbon-helix-helix protein